MYQCFRFAINLSTHKEHCVFATRYIVQWQYSFLVCSVKDTSYVEKLNIHFYKKCVQVKSHVFPLSPPLLLLMPRFLHSHLL